MAKSKSKKKKGKKQLNEILDALEERYGENIYPPQTKQVVDLFLYSLLSFYNSKTRAKKGYRALGDEFVDWNELRVSSPREVTAVLEEQGIEPAEHIAERIKETLYGVYYHTHTMSLDFLPDHEDPRTWLGKLEGLEQWMLDYLLLMSCKEAVVPFDPATERIMERIGYLSRGENVTKRREKLAKLLPKKQKAISRFHHLMVEHGKKLCLESGPKCDKCPVLELELCDFGLEQQ